MDEWIDIRKGNKRCFGLYLVTVCVCVCVYMWVCTLTLNCSQMTEEDIGFPGAGVPGDSGPLDLSAQSQPLYSVCKRSLYSSLMSHPSRPSVFFVFPSNPW